MNRLAYAIMWLVTVIAECWRELFLFSGLALVILLCYFGK